MPIKILDKAMMLFIAFPSLFEKVPDVLDRIINSKLLHKFFNLSDNYIFPKVENLLGEGAFKFLGAVAGVLLMIFASEFMVYAEMKDLMISLLPIIIFFFFILVIKKKLSETQGNEIIRNAVTLSLILTILFNSKIIGVLSLFILNWHIINLAGSRKGSVTISHYYRVILLLMYIVIKSLGVEIPFEYGFLFLGSFALMSLPVLSYQSPDDFRCREVKLDDVRVASLYLFCAIIALIFQMNFLLMVIALSLIMNLMVYIWDIYTTD